MHVSAAIGHKVQRRNPLGLLADTLLYRPDHSTSVRWRAYRPYDLVRLPGHGLTRLSRNASKRAASFLQAQQPRVDGHDHRDRGHQRRPQGGREQYASSVERPGRQRDGDDVVARGPDEVLNHLPIGGAG